MIRSMTGFGRAEVPGESFAIAVEARSVNHRHLEIAIRLPSPLASLELDSRRLVQSRLERGRIDVTVQMTPVSGDAKPDVRVDAALARRYLAEARSLARQLRVGGNGLLTWLLERPGVVRLEETALPDASALWPQLSRALADALDMLVARRAAEGAGLATGLRGLVADLGSTVTVMTVRAPVAARRRGDRLRERLTGLLGDTTIDEARVVMEVAVWAQKTDVTEELTRLRIHLDEVALMLDKGGPVGRPLDFLIQELGREVNTVAAKADDLELSQAALAAKGILEKMREQVQNLE